MYLHQNIMQLYSFFTAYMPEVLSSKHRVDRVTTDKKYVSSKKNIYHIFRLHDFNICDKNDL